MLRADFTYQDTTQMTGGSLLTMLKMAGPFARQAREPVVSTHMIKGDRMVTITKDRTTIIDLSKETITEIDNAKKTYSEITFAQMKQAMEDAMSRMQRGKDQKVDAKFNVSAKATGQTKTIQGLTAKELIITMTMEGADKESGQTGGMATTMDTWVAPLRGYDEVKAFHRRMGEKMGYLFGSGMSQMGMTQPDVAKGFAEAAKEMQKLDGTPVQTITKMTGSANGQPVRESTAENQQREQQPQGPPTSTGAAIGRLAGGLGGFGRKKKDDQQQQTTANPDQQAASSSSSLIEMTTELTSYSSGPVDASKFEVPAGFKQVESPMMKRR